MECKEIQKLIKDFAEDTLSLSQEELMIEHFENCSDCREELEIHYIVSYGLSDEENASYPSERYKELIESYDFEGLVQLKLDDVDKKIKREREYIRIGKLMLFVTNAIIVSAMALLLLFEQL